MKNYSPLPDRDITSFPDTRAGALDFGRMRSQFKKNLGRYRKERGLGPEYKLIGAIVDNCKFNAPWAWMDIKGQKDMAERFGVSERTLKNHLAACRAGGYITTLHREWKGTWYPTYIVHPQLVWECAHWHLPGYWPVKTLDLISVVDVSDRSLSPQERGDSALSGSANSALGPTECRNCTEEEIPANSGISQVDGRKCTPVNIAPINTLSSISNHSISRDSLRQGRRKVNGMRKRIEDEDGPVIGRDPSTTASTSAAPSTGSTGTPASRVTAHFARRWTQVHIKNPSGTPAQPWASGAKVRCMSWIKKTMLPRYAGDEEHAKRVIDAFCESTWYNPAQPYPVWSQMSFRLDKIDASLAQQGHLSGEAAAEKVLRDEERKAQQEKNAQLHSMLKAKAEEQRRRETEKVSVKALTLDEMGLDI